MTDNNLVLTPNKVPIRIVAILLMLATIFSCILLRQDGLTSSPHGQDFITCCILTFVLFVVATLSILNALDKQAGSIVLSPEGVRAFGILGRETKLHWGEIVAFYPLGLFPDRWAQTSVVCYYLTDKPFKGRILTGQAYKGYTHAKLAATLNEWKQNYKYLE